MKKFVIALACSSLLITYLPCEEPLQIDKSQPNPALEAYQDLLTFWFGELKDPAFYPQEKEVIWRGGPETTHFIESNYREFFDQALAGDLNEWRQTPRGRLALILLLDQFSRHLYPQTTKAFALDPMARGLVLEGIQKGDDKKLFPIERAFFYLPLERSEEKRFQDLSVASYLRLLYESPEPIKGNVQGFLDAARKNQRVIEQFGRFPHRNQALGRKPTAAEVIFLRSQKTH
ncbi:MAG: DUF924 domain-containing protein [Parachlamydia sp.]|jgi:uncharacterized protein (DUF924 family)|nr:DUF924 domain-containing protein [Parachlamydia sp.]